MQQALVQYEKGDLREEDRKLTAGIKSAWADYQPVVKKIAALVSTGKQAEAVWLLKSDEAGVAKGMNEAVDKIIKINVRDGKGKSDANRVLANGAVKIMITLVVVAVVLVLGLDIFISRIIMRQLGADPKEVGEIADLVAVGDLSREIILNSGDSSRIMASMKNMVDAENVLVSDAAMLSKAAVEGKVATRADASKHSGPTNAPHRSLMPPTA